jgi:GTPase SAR1 family protein
MPVIMVGSKLDLEYKRAVSREDAFELAKKNNLYTYVECSSKSGQNVEEIFIEISRFMMKKAGLIEV